ncbi:MAG: hypothetical protein Rubg2KO_03930 [Rubricoccaceae bacterium]
MATIRSPKGLALTVLATLTIAVLWLGSHSALMTLRGLEEYNYAAWLRGHALPIAIGFIGLTIWVGMALLFYVVPLTTTRLLALCLLLVFGSAATVRVVDWDLPLGDRFLPAKIIGHIPNGILDTRWKGLDIVCDVELIDFEIDNSGRVTRRSWIAPESWLILPLYHLRVTPPTQPVINQGRLIGDVIYWDWGPVQRVWQEGDRLRFEWIPASKVTTDPPPARD